MFMYNLAVPRAQDDTTTGKKITVTKTVKKNMARVRIAAVEQPTARNAPVARPYAHPTTSTKLQLRHPSS